MHEEMRFHIEMEAERLVREQGLDPREARRRAYVAFGGLEKFKAAGRDTRGVQWIDIVSLDARLGVRMLIKHPGLTVVGGVAMAVAIAIGATFFEVSREVLNPALPIEDGERVVALRYATSIPGSAERRLLRDFTAWREEIRSVEHLAAFRDARHNLVSGKAPHEPIAVAEITASGFTVARTPPLLGRYLVPADERETAPPVVVIGHHVWQSRFFGDPNVVGRTMNIGGTPTAVVGVMPDGFRFPLDHQYWMPLRVDSERHGRLQGLRIHVFGRLAPGLTVEQAQAELMTLMQREAAADTKASAELRPVVLPYTREHFGISDPFRLWAFRLAQLFVGALTLVVAVNLAILLYARTVTRAGEIAMRTALGASRRRILAQLFVEALVLSLLGGAAGLLLARVALGRLRSVMLSNGGGAFWVSFELSVATVAYAIALAVLAALIIGVLPGLKATSGRVSTNLRELNGGSGARLGPVWTTLVVAQVAVAVAVLPLAVFMSWQVVKMGLAGPGLAAHEFLVGFVEIGDEGSGIDPGRRRTRQLDLIATLQAEPGVSAVTFSSDVPGFAPGRMLQFHEGPGVKYPGASLGADSLDVAPELFSVYEAEVLAGRSFTAADLDAAHAVVVNRAFVQAFIEAADSPGTALGVRFRYVATSERPGTRADTSYQIVGVVSDFPAFPPEPGSDGQPTIYHPAAPGAVHPVALSVRFDGAVPAGFGDRFRAVGAAVDPALLVRRVQPLMDFYDQQRSFWRSLTWGVGLLTVSVLLLSAAGVYALMAFTVAQRAREIAIRAALGASPRRLIVTIFGRAARQLSMGLLVGALVSAGIFQNTDVTHAEAAALTLIVAGTLAIIGMVAAAGPARRGLRIQASEALRADG
jgi:predicted permease